eukprot:3545564-Rhodomonas_salina.2
MQFTKSKSSTNLNRSPMRSNCTAKVQNRGRTIPRRKVTVVPNPAPPGLFGASLTGAQQGWVQSVPLRSAALVWHRSVLTYYLFGAEGRHRAVDSPWIQSLPRGCAAVSSSRVDTSAANWHHHPLISCSAELDRLRSLFCVAG